MLGSTADSCSCVRLRRLLRFTLQKTVEIPQLQFFKVVEISFIVQRQVSMVLLFSRPCCFHGCSSWTRWSTSLLCRSSKFREDCSGWVAAGASSQVRQSCSHGCTRWETRHAQTSESLGTSWGSSSSRRWADREIFRALYTGTGPGVVSTGTRPHN